MFFLHSTVVTRNIHNGKIKRTNKIVQDQNNCNTV